MRWSFLVVIALAAVVSAGAQAAPTCQDIAGETIRCGTPGAMPVGWTLPAELRVSRQASQMEPHQLLAMICVVGGLFALLALLPDFQGEWDKESSDDEGRR